MVDINKIEKVITEKLSQGLDPRLTYHGIHHTLDVVREALRIAAEENVTDEEDLLLLHIAALFHDSGFLFTYAEHEEKGIEIAREMLPAFGISAGQLERICGMILATKIPQSPKNLLEEIICDADLDYLGRNDFPLISKSLYQEWSAYQYIKDEADWDQKQIRFLEAHHYFTKSSIALRSNIKAGYLAEIKKEASS